VIDKDLMDRSIKSSTQAKENADDLVASKKELDAQVEENRKKTKEFEVLMRQKTCTVGNIVGKGVPVSQTEVSPSYGRIILVLFSWIGRQCNTAHMASRWSKR